MPTIVQYTDQEVPVNEYPSRIISPTRSARCCFSGMEAISAVEQEGPWQYEYRRCRTCGYTVRFVVREIPDENLIKELRDILAVSFQRNVPDF